MKKILPVALIILALSLVLTLVACNGKTENNTTATTVAAAEDGETEIASENNTNPKHNTEKHSNYSSHDNPTEADKTYKIPVIIKPGKTTATDKGTATGATSGAQFPGNTAKSDKTTALKSTVPTTTAATTRRPATTTKPSQTAVVTATDGGGNLFTVIVSEAS